MEGNLEYNLVNESHIKKMLDKNTELKGFYSFMSDLSRTSAYNYLGKVSDFLKTTNKVPNELTFDDFTGYIMMKRKTSKGTISTASYRVQVYHALKKYGEYLTAIGVFTSNPMDMVKRPANKDSQTTIEKRQKGYLSKTEIKTYLDSVKSGAKKDWKERDLAIIYIFLTTGIRASAMYKLDVSSINFEHKRLIVTDKEERINEHYLSDSTLEVIREWLIKRNRLLNGKQTEALFISNRLTRMGNAGIVKVVKKYASGIEGKHITPHKLRATYGTQLYEETKDVYFVQKCMGHSSPTTTELYIRGKENYTVEASAIMESLL